jgi:hypothetical protein
MKPAPLDAAAPSTQTMPHTTASHLKIVEIELPQQEGLRYDVMLRLCRPLTSYEIDELRVHQSIGLDVSPDDPSRLVATHTTVEDVRDRLPEFHELLAAALADAHGAQDSADHVQDALAAEEARRQQLVSETNTRLGACDHTDDPAVDAT